MALTTNKSRRHHTFNVADWVLFRRQAYRQTSLLARGQNKFSQKFYDSYPISRRIGEVAYELLLLPSSKIHPDGRGPSTTFHKGHPQEGLGQPLHEGNPKRSV